MLIKRWNRLFSPLLVCLIFISCQADDKKPLNPVMQRHLDDYEAPGRPWGFIDADGNIQIKAKFDDVRSYSEGMAAVNEHGLWGYIDKTGKYVFKPEFLKAHHFQQGLARVRGGDGQMGLIDQEGDTIVSFVYDEIYARQHGLYIAEKSQRKGVIDPQGRQLIDQHYLDIKIINQNLFALKADEYYILMNTAHETIITSILSAKSDGRLKTNKGWGAVDADGNWLVKPHASSIALGHDGHYIIGNGKKIELYQPAKDQRKALSGDRVKYLGNSRYASKTQEGWFLVNANDQRLNPRAFESIYSFSEGVAGYQVDGWWGYIDTSGQILIEPIFALPWLSSEGKQRLFTREGFGFHNRTGSVLIEPKFSDVRDFSEGFAAFQK